mgnify:CR=1 FL=1
MKRNLSLVSRLSLRDEVQGAIEDAAYLLAQMPGSLGQKITILVTTPDLLALGSNPVVSRRQAGRLIASTQRRLRRGRCVVTLQWETSAPLEKKKPMNLREFLRYVEAA